MVLVVACSELCFEVFQIQAQAAAAKTRKVPERDARSFRKHPQHANTTRRLPNQLRWDEAQDEITKSPELCQMLC